VDALTLRKAIQDAVSRAFGLVHAGTYADILWVAEDGSEMVMRVKDACVALQVILESMK
jgi:hypothetical protein